MKRLYDKALMEQIARVYGNEITFLSEFSKALLDIIREGLIRDGQVRLHQFGTFKLKWMKSRTGVNPSTGEKIMIQARPRVIFLPAKMLKERIEPNPPVLQPFGQAESIESNAELVTEKINITSETENTVHQGLADELNSVQNDAVSSELENDFQESKVKPPETEEVVADIRDEIEVLEQVVNILKAEAKEVEATASMKGEIDTDWLDHSVVEKIKEISELQYFKKTDDQRTGQHVKNDSISVPEETAGIDINLGSLSHEADSTDNQHKDNYSAKPWFAIAAAIIVLLATGILFNTLELGNSENVPRDDKQLADLPLQPRYLLPVEKNVPVNEPLIASQVHIPVDIIIDNDELESLSRDTSNVITALPETTRTTVDESDAESIVVSTETYDEVKRFTSEQHVYFTAIEHKLTDGDSLWRLAKKHYINPFYWPHIYQANHNKINNPDKVKIGKVINLPTLYGDPENLTQLDKHNIAMGYYYNYLYHKGKGNPFAYFSLIGVEKFEPTLLIEYKEEIERSDVNNLALLTE